MTIPFVCVLAAWVLIWVPRLLVAVAQSKMPEGLDNQNPRDQQLRLTGWGKRAQGAHLNAFENFAPFAAAVLIAHAGHGDEKKAGLLAIAFVGLRVIYTALYVANLDKLRSLVWVGGAAVTGALFVLPWLG